MIRVKLKAPAGLKRTGIHGKDGKEYPVGTVVPVEKIPAGWKDRCEVIDDDEGKELVVNPAPAKAEAPKKTTTRKKAPAKRGPAKKPAQKVN